jgi:hypothetical protein
MERIEYSVEAFDDLVGIATQKYVPASEHPSQKAKRVIEKQKGQIFNAPENESGDQKRHGSENGYEEIDGIDSPGDHLHC